MRRGFRFLILFAALASTLALAQNTAVPGATPQTIVIDTWLTRLSKPGGGTILSRGESDDRLKYIEGLAAKWKASTNESDFAQISEAVYTMAKEERKRSKVTIETSRGAGATVKYQEVSERKYGVPQRTCKRLTPAEEQILIGSYFIWAERNGKATSNTTARYDLADVEERIMLQENSKGQVGSSYSPD